jgi:hypothetical protein
MDSHIFIALVGGLVNMALSVTVPCLVKKTNQPFLNDVKKVFETNRQVIITSSLIVALTIYLALKIAPDFYSSFNQLTGLETDSASINLTHKPIIIDAQLNPQLRNLMKLMN